LFASVLSVTVFAQKDVDAVSLADEMYNFGDKKDALDVYVQALQYNPNNIRANYMIGICYLETINKDKSVPYFQKAYELNPKISYEIFYLIGKGYHYGNKFDEAITNYTKFIEETNNSSEIPKDVSKPSLIKKAQKKISECENAKLAFSQPRNVNITLLGEEINTPYPDYAPVITPDESILLFTSRRQGTTGKKKDRDNEFFEDVYISQRTDSVWGYAKNLGEPINTDIHDGSIGISPDGKELYLYKEDNGGDIYSSIKDKEGKWSKPKPVQGKINTKYNEPSICFSSDGNFLFFTSSRKEGRGGLDIYFCKKDKKGKWSDPVNLGSAINTEYEEDCPYFEVKDSTLYFSSNGHQNIGGYDIYKSKLNNGVWSKPENLGVPVNTTDDDIYFVISGDGKHGYFSSVSDKGYGDKDIYRLDMSKADEIVQPIPEAQPEAAVVDSAINSNSKADEIIAVAPATEEPVATPEPVVEPENAPTEETGSMKPIPKSEEHHAIKPVPVKEKPVLKHINATSPQKKKPVRKSSVAHLDLSMLPVGKIVILRNVYFEFDKTVFTKESLPELEDLTNLLSSNPSLKIEIGGHTDALGNPEYNNILSQNRAKAVVSYLTSKGIDSSRLSYKGYGEHIPLASNDDEDEGRELNRRTEFKVIER
jgi:outer membrane protein OmpA-like peptidoglycan-associated protein